MPDILGGERFINVVPIKKGHLYIKKYCVTHSNGTKYLLRIEPIEYYESNKSRFDKQKQVAELGIPMCLPIEFGTCADGVYSLHSWVDGEDLVTVLPSLSQTDQYALGIQSGEILKKIHSSFTSDSQKKWYLHYNRYIDNVIQKYRKCGIRFDGEAYFIVYIEDNRHLLKNRPQCFLHNDYHSHNIMIKQNRLTIIDFWNSRFGDPWAEFQSMVWKSGVSPHFATGELHGYFGGEPPYEFFKLLALYMAVFNLNTITWLKNRCGIPWFDTLLRQLQHVLPEFDNMWNPIPTWYLKDLRVSTFERAYRFYCNQ